MRFARLRLWSAGLLAWLVGVPMSEKALAQDGIVGSSIGLGLAIADSAGES